MSYINLLYEKLLSQEERSFFYYENGKRHQLSFPELLTTVQKTASFLKSKDIKQGDRIGIVSPNSFEWVVLDLTCIMLGVITVPFHDIKSIPEPQQVMEKFDLALLFTEKELFQYFQDDSRLLALADLRSLVENFPALAQDEFVQTEDEAIFSFVFTSGTTGVPKAIQMRKKSVDDFLINTNKMFEFSASDKAIIFLPLSHFGQRSYIYGSILFGFDFVMVSTDNLFQSFRKDQPTILVGVPYFFENLYKTIEGTTKEEGQLMLQTILGGKIRLMVTGSAPISYEVLKAFNDLGMPLLEAYGTNETGLIALSYPGHHKVGSVGKLFPNKEIRFTKNNVIQIRSDYAWGKAYFKDKETSKNVFLEDGFINTGDIGYLDEDGFLFLKGRDSELIILSNGKKVHPQSVESQIKSYKNIKQVCIFGNNKPHLTAVIVTEADNNLEESIRQFNTSVPEFSKLAGYINTPTPFSVENGFLTSSLKINRDKIYAHYQKELEAFY